MSLNFSRHLARVRNGRGRRFRRLCWGQTNALGTSVAWLEDAELRRGSAELDAGTEL